MQTSFVGSCMRFYEHMQAPGIDVLTEHRRIYETAKQVSSVARQFGRKWRLTETYGCTGWDFPFAGHKALGDWQAALGINLRCHHLAWYTMEGQAKRDYPAGISYQSPWWELYPKVEDYFARIHAVMTRGMEIRDLLVVHPVESMWTLFRKGSARNVNINAYDAMLITLRESLLKENIDFDYGDEDILARHGRIGKKDGRPLLRVGKAVYKTVVVPPLRTIRSTTLKLLEKFRAAGGEVVFAGKAARFVDAMPSKAAEEFAATCIRTSARGRRLVAAVEPVARRISIADSDGNQVQPALYLLREDRDAFYLFVCNTGHSARQLKPAMDDPTMVRDRRTGFPDVHIRGLAECAGRPLELDPETGAIFTADAVRDSGCWDIRTSLRPSGSRLFVVPKKKTRKTYPPRTRFKDVREVALGGTVWDIAASESNCLVLDRPRYRIGSGRWRKADDILHIDFAVRDALGISRRGGAMMQPWVRKRLPNPRRTTVTLAYTFDVKALPNGDLFLALERPGTFRVAVNRMPVSADTECGWWCDQSLRKLRFDPALLRTGRNEIVLTCDYDENHPGLEIIYLLGNFGTRVKGSNVTVTKMPASLRIGDWVKQGLAFYSGSVSYCRTISVELCGSERVFVLVPEWRGAAVRVLVDGQNAGIIAWEPNEADITDLIGDDNPVDLRIEVIGHRRNSHGPLHNIDKWPRWTGPAQFVSPGDKWTDSYQLVPCGLMQPPRLVIRKPAALPKNIGQE